MNAGWECKGIPTSEHSSGAKALDQDPQGSKMGPKS